MAFQNSSWNGSLNTALAEERQSYRSELEQLDQSDDDHDDAGIDIDIGGDDLGGQVDLEAEEDELGMGYEQLCKKHVECFFEGSNKHMTESELSKRVGEWQVVLSS